MRRQAVLLVGFVVISLGALLGTLLAGNEPLLGVDLQGGVSVVLEPVTDADDDRLDEAVEVIRSRVDGLGVAEPEITRQGDTILVQLPGVDDQERALELVGQTAELRFRPVLAELGPVIEAPEVPATTVVPAEGATTTTAGDEPDGEAPATTAAPDELEAPTTTAAESVGFQDEPATTVPVTTVPAETSTTGADEGADEGDGDEPEATTTTVAPEPAGPVEPDPTAPLGSRARCLADFADREAEGIPIASEPNDALAVLETADFTAPEDDLVCDEVILPQLVDGEVVNRYWLGPTAFTGDVLSDADAAFQLEWFVLADLKGGDEGQGKFNEVAGLCTSANPVCPNNQFAFVLDSDVITAPTFQASSFGDQVTITGAFTEGEARDTALALRYGSLPVAFDTPTAQTVSATIGADSLDAGVIAGIVGLALVTLYLLAYYRLLGLIAIASLGLSTALLWSIIAWLGESRGLALTLAGVTGIIVSIGVAVDSNIVYFEHLKEDVRNGRKPRSAVDRAFPVAFSTIVKADVASLIGAALLYWLTTGAVRGFAFYLGLATLLDLVATYFFMGPAVRLVSRSPAFYEHPERWGLPAAARDLAPEVAS